jgi:hypothetical protein
MILTILFIVAVALWAIFLFTEPRSKRDILSFVAVVLLGLAAFGFKF